MDKIVYKLWDKKEEVFASSYSRVYHDEIEWSSESNARNANCHGMFEDKTRYAVKKYRVTYEEIED